ncbi:ACP S-malonyltransferase [Streptomyces durbertensis]|uniref:Malonyl CoA-acyl carrier protein transacylase n=1 Tax=Streptomyces durbertensis TaxID=2448886 RepID=A0ABR6EBC9_9ACTN|nr:ACP S-malonyltransferase [Streptomyces durbertensis]MBB1242387.1 ACP S-malonyltransferase [Streptomyces durbertensis]
MTVTTIFMFPGQGAQRVGMGRELFDRFPELEQEASDVLGYRLRELCLADPNGQLGETRYTQPAMFVVNALAYRAALADGAERPDVAIGHSLGEYNALEAAGVFDFADGLRLVAARAAAMAEVRGGGMSAVVGLSEVTLRFLLLRAGFASLDLANLNTAAQTVVAGPVADLEEAGQVLEDAGARMVRRLTVSGPFHSRYMAPARAALDPLVRSLPLRAPAFPVLANRTTEPYRPDNTAELLLEQIDHPVRWRETVESLLRWHDPRFTEIGESTVLRSMLRQIRRDTTADISTGEPAADTGSTQPPRPVRQPVAA